MLSGPNENGLAGGDDRNEARPRQSWTGGKKTLMLNILQDADGVETDSYPARLSM